MTNDPLAHWSTIVALPASAPGRHGFSLLELLVVLVIMGVLSGVVVASMVPALAQARLHTGARMVIAALRYARSHAIAQRTDARVLLIRANRQVAVEVPETAETIVPDEVAAWRPLTTPAGRLRTLPMGITFAAVERPDGAEPVEEPTVRFTPLGQGETVRIVLEDAKGRQQAVVVDAVTGRCALAEDEP